MKSCFPVFGCRHSIESGWFWVWRRQHHLHVIHNRKSFFPASPGIIWNHFLVLFSRSQKPIAMIPPSCLDNGYNCIDFPEPLKQQILHRLQLKSSHQGGLKSEAEHPKTSVVPWARLLKTKTGSDFSNYIAGFTVIQVSGHKTERGIFSMCLYTWCGG